MYKTILRNLALCIPLALVSASAFADLAPERGYAVAPGVSMLLHQAAEQFRMMTGHTAPLEAMRAAVGMVRP